MVLEFEHIWFVAIARRGFVEDVSEENDLKLV